ncbi:type II toxin-antitoxin system Phd/YefM family antitoxin [Solimonas terrae]|uniref:Antitoxin n=1 Tax=Solimonas terrae TaxID=1396819 RepID=A0A6M2BXB0_9GAMM|nr:type II toxin-antitoxin system Phd/YefM family antitoxin [Solimonas terrae]NGY06507.1 type II toxin-antitoxin system Phd/YefM family antitoxin [Solimonas terrae]
MKAVSIADAKNRLTELLYAAEDGQPVQVTRRGQPVAVLLSDAEYLRLKNAAAASVDFASWARQWRDQLAPGIEGITAAELERWREL